MKEIHVQRFSIVSSKSFMEVESAFERSVGHPDMVAFRKNISAAKTYADLRGIVEQVTSPSGLMEFTRFDLGEVLRKGNPSAPHCVRFLVGNPLIMRQMAERVPDAGSYAPVTILIDERSDGVHLSYDQMATFLASYGDAKALEVAKDLDRKVESLLVSAAAA